MSRLRLTSRRCGRISTASSIRRDNPLARDGRGAFELFTAHRDGRPVGRIVAAMHDASNRRHGTRRGQFGFFDCADDPAVADALLSAAEAWVRERGAEEIVGNFNLTAMQMVGRGDRRLRERALHRHDVVAAAYRAPARRRGLRAVLSDDDIRDGPHARRSRGPDRPEAGRDPGRRPIHVAPDPAARLQGRDGRRARRAE